MPSLGHLDHPCSDHHSLCGDTWGWDSALQKLKQRKLWEYGWAGALEPWRLPSGMVILAIWEMFQVGHYLVFKQKHFFKKPHCSFSNVFGFITSAFEAVSTRFLKTCLSEDADRSLSRVLNSLKSWYPRSFESRILSA